MITSAWSLVVPGLGGRRGEGVLLRLELRARRCGGGYVGRRISAIPRSAVRDRISRPIRGYGCDRQVSGVHVERDTSGRGPARGFTKSGCASSDGLSVIVTGSSRTKGEDPELVRLPTRTVFGASSSRTDHRPAPADVIGIARQRGIQIRPCFISLSAQWCRSGSRVVIRFVRRSSQRGIQRTIQI